MSALRAVVIRPGRAAYGEVRRTQTWIKLFRAAGGEASDIGFLAGGPRPTLAGTGCLLRGELVPEAMVWNGAQMRDRLLKQPPDVVILQTARSYRPELVDGPWVTILDLVDRLSASYHQRAAFSRGARALLFGSLARAHARFEARAAELVPRVVAAGRRDAALLGAVWVPNLVERSARPRRVESKPFDVVFFGSLGYRPNIDALHWLAEADTRAAELRVLIAGHGPTQEVRSLCASQGWTLVEDYPDNEWLAEQANVALAPLRSTAGIQNKVLEAASMGLAQVVAPAALAGFDDGFPTRVAESPAELVAAVKELAGDDVARRQLADDAWAFAHAHYTTDAWVPTLWQLVEDPASEAPRWVDAPVAAAI